MFVTKSDLLSSAARRVTSTSSGVAPNMLANWGPTASGARRSNIEPNLAWKVNVPSRGV